MQVSDAASDRRRESVGVRNAAQVRGKHGATQAVSHDQSVAEGRPAC